MFRELSVGDVLRSEDGEYALVGDINTLCGVCDCCTDDQVDWELIGNAFVAPSLLDLFPKDPDGSVPPLNVSSCPRNEP